MEQFWKVLFFVCLGISTIVTTLAQPVNRASSYVPTMCYDSRGRPSKNCLGGWFYSAKLASKNAKFAKAHNWNYVLLSSNVKSDWDKQYLINNVLAFRRQNIAVHIMCLEDTVYIDNPVSAYEEISNILKFVNENNLDIQGIHTDCEPHARADWKNASVEEKNKIFAKYLEVIEYGRKAINEFRPNTVYSGAVAWWYSILTKNGELQNGRGYDLVQTKRFDFIIPMIYDGAGGSVDAVVSKSEDYITDKAASVIGIAVKDYEYKNFNTIMSKIKKYCTNSKYFNGFSVFANIYYPDWDNY